MKLSFIEKSAAIHIPLGKWDINIPFTELLFGPSDTSKDIKDLVRLGLIGVGLLGTMKALGSLMLYRDPYFFSAPSRKTFSGGAIRLSDIIPEPDKPSAQELMVLKHELSDKKVKKGFYKEAAGLSILRFVDLAMRHPFLTIGTFAAVPAVSPLIDSLYKNIRKQYLTHHASIYKRQFLDEVKKTVAISNLTARNDLRLQDIHMLPEETRLDIRNRLLSETGKDYSKLLNVPSPEIESEETKQSSAQQTKTAVVRLLKAPLDVAAFPFKQLFSYGLLAGAGLFGLPLVSGILNLQSTVSKYPINTSPKALKDELERWQSGALELEEEGGYVLPPSSFFQLREKPPMDYEHPSVEAQRVSRAVERRLKEMERLENMESAQARQTLKETARNDAKERAVTKKKVRKTTILI